jgi:hypothetical protein
MRWSLVTVALALAMLVAPVAGIAADGAAQSADPEERETDRVTFYGSIFGHGLFEPMPMNTIYPYGEDNFGTGYLANCGPGPAVESCEAASWNKVALYSTAGPVPVEDRSQFLRNGAWAQLHNERGQLTSIQLDQDESVTAGIYFAYSLHGWPRNTANEHGTNCIYPHPENVPCLWPNWRWHPGVFEDVVMEATLYAADLGDMHANASDPPPVEDRIQRGEARVIANGQWGPNTVVNGLPEYPNAAHAEIDLGPPQSATIEANEDFILVFSSYMETGGQKYNAGSPLRWYSGEFFPPTMELPVENAITVERVLPYEAHDQLAMVSVVSMPWGSYDVEGEDIAFQIEGPNGPVDLDPDNVEKLPIDQSMAHGGHYEPVNKTLVWDYRNADIEPGEYEVTVTATNLQGSATHSCTGTFTLESGEDGVVAGETKSGLCGEQTLGEEALGEVVDEATEE